MVIGNPLTLRIFVKFCKNCLKLSSAHLFEFKEFRLDLISFQATKYSYRIRLVYYLIYVINL